MPSAPYLTYIPMEMELDPFLGVVLATAVLLVAVLRRKRGSSRKYKMPPGPRPWPVIGNLNLIGALPHRSIHALSARHGAFMSLRFGSVPVVVGSSVETARFFLRTSDTSFIDRPRMAAGKYTAYDYSDIVWSPCGAYWRQARKLWKAHLFSDRQLRSQEHVRSEELRVLLHALSSSSSAGVAGRGRRAVALKEHLLMYSLNVISRMALGGKYVGEGGTAGSPISPAEFSWMVDELFLLNGVFCVGDFIPWLGWLDLQGYVGRMKRLGKMFDRFLEHVVDEHDQRRRREGGGFVPADMVDLLLELADDPKLEVPIERDGVKGFALVRLANNSLLRRLAGRFDHKLKFNNNMLVVCPQIPHQELSIYLDMISSSPVYLINQSLSIMLI